MKYTLSQIQLITGGRVIGNLNTIITGIASIETAKEGDITFIKDDTLIPQALLSKASVIVTHREIGTLKRPQIVIETNPFLAFTKLMEVIAKEKHNRPIGIHPLSSISKEAILGKEVSIGAYVIIEDRVRIGNNVTIYPNTFIGKESSIGDGSLIYPHVTIREEVTIGKRVIIHSNSVIGEDGFGYLQIQGKHTKIPQIGTVEIGDDVEIGAVVTICRAALDKTIIGNGVKIDNHSHIAHNVTIGDNTILIAYAKIAGSTRIGKNVMIAEDVGITDHVDIGDNCIIGGGSNVYKSLESGSVVWGSPAKPINDEKRIQVVMKKLPEMYHAIKKYLKTLP
ncbi:MAG: UDP-3-O-(3-hydroxymyristoyl)glucosamine N-acyltransferase [Candidatus Jettenia sp.]|uniref:UDP-3-O-acylglucosamine N-acyltransferase n=1 Tax=Candidatus Jettenia caeni TaxID=247490 RepID=I3IHH5_9BACT|nr:UDP-3-O-(3-hydroxymyristoyl)glucosamine N-acyltransferase [Candidatus Jettenia sp. AMX1]MBC6929866.1 UDP-3-O-(3-hydroxymyristoyl)glucosamine N-acyltransferase [Candidatus Jettenia sp.]NUN24582.1 UDP-3-O-(3-hydroxymyristoyl)glucosamine N-acyltransferase [Candidatus Jettenia caeni]KAA0248645.1 MAG: UDP-3-O-(3-hydroxymyristoyl)glucosamine N-acyltransferase [Candidatus Jettenia sp. AMX1]MCE7881507.1 UDP-3-O-(3-hydroxymyristoyl)glucosamine N-acyltransferase [Candidatus Jettenia sp. AMX1]MCQ39281